MSNVNIIVDIGDGVQLVQRVLNALHIGPAGVGFGALRHAQVRNQIRQGIRLNDGDDAQVVVLGHAQNRRNLVNILRLVHCQAIVGDG